MDLLRPYVLLASFLVINVLLAIIINSMEEVHEAEREEERRRRGEEIASADGTVAERLEEIRAALDRLEAQLAEAAGRPARSGALDQAPDQGWPDAPWSAGLRGCRTCRRRRPRRRRARPRDLVAQVVDVVLDHRQLALGRALAAGDRVHAALERVELFGECRDILLGRLRGLLLDRLDLVSARTSSLVAPRPWR